MTSHPTRTDRKSVALESRRLKTAAGSFPGSCQEAAGLVAHDSKCPVLGAKIFKSENGHLFGSKWSVIAQ